MKDSCKLDYFYPKINESLNSSGVISSIFKIKRANNVKDFFIGEISNRDKVNNYIRKYVNFLEFFI